MMRLLVFDDDEGMGRLVRRIAVLAGYQADAVTTALAFHAGVKALAPDVIVLDLQLGDTDGVEQLRLLSAQQYDGTVILISGYDERVLSVAAKLARDLGLRVGPPLNKPIQVEQLEAVLERLKTSSSRITPQRVMQALQNDELSIELQPIVSRNPNTLKKLEALIRWVHPTIGCIAPDRFIPVAESDVVAMDGLTGWLLDAVIDAYHVLAELGIRVPIAMNVSAQNLHDRSLPDRVEQRLRNANVPTEHLCLELTESAVFADPVHSADVLTRARLKGLQLAIDDFGTGYSSLKMLRRMPFTTLKIDREFIGDLLESHDSQAITKSIIDLAANMNLECIAEGVENDDVATMLEQLGVGAMQGYLIARPMPVEAVASWLASWADGGLILPQPLATVPGDGETETCALLRLSPRQRDVMQLLAQGQSVKEIASNLNLALGTVKVHLSLAYAALGARNRVDAVTRLTRADDDREVAVMA